MLDLCVAELLLLLRVRQSSPARYHSANITRSYVQFNHQEMHFFIFKNKLEFTLKYA
jgi:hypothetical protein